MSVVWPTDVKQQTDNALELTQLTFLDKSVWNFLGKNLNSFIFLLETEFILICPDCTHLEEHVLKAKRKSLLFFV